MKKKIIFDLCLSTEFYIINRHRHKFIGRTVDDDRFCFVKTNDGWWVHDDLVFTFLFVEGETILDA